MPPVTQKLIAAVAIFVVVIGSLGFAIYKQTGDNADLQQSVDGLRNEIAGLDAIIATREQKKKNRDAQEDVLKSLVSILPPYSERQEERVYEAVTQYASLAKLKFGGIIPRAVVSAPVRPTGGGPPGAPAPPAPPKPPGAAASDFAQTELALKFDGTFFNFLKFVNMVENHESFLRVDQLSLVPARPTAGPQPENLDVTVTVKISTFQYAPK